MCYSFCDNVRGYQLVDIGEVARWRDIRSKWCMRHMGANSFRQFKNKHVNEYV
jgi:hypothetical protein